MYVKENVMNDILGAMEAQREVDSFRPGFCISLGSNKGKEYSKERRTRTQAKETTGCIWRMRVFCFHWNVRWMKG